MEGDDRDEPFYATHPALCQRFRDLTSQLQLLEQEPPDSDVKLLELLPRAELELRMRTINSQTAQLAKDEHAEVCCLCLSARVSYLCVCVYVCVCVW